MRKPSLPQSLGDAFDDVFGDVFGDVFDDVFDDVLDDERKPSALYQRALLQRPPLVDPAAILRAHLVSISEARIRLKHPGPIRFEDDPLGFFHGLSQAGAHHVEIHPSRTVFMFFDCANEILHPLSRLRLEEPDRGARRTPSRNPPGLALDF